MLQQHQLPRSEPSGQSIEESHLVTSGFAVTMSFANSAAQISLGVLSNGGALSITISALPFQASSSGAMSCSESPCTRANLLSASLLGSTPAAIAMPCARRASAHSSPKPPTPTMRAVLGVSCMRKFLNRHYAFGFHALKSFPTCLTRVPNIAECKIGVALPKETWTNLPVAFDETDRTDLDAIGSRPMDWTVIAHAPIRICATYAHNATEAGGKLQRMTRLPKRVAVHGVGKIAQLKYLPYVASKSGLELAAFCDANQRGNVQITWK